MIYRSGGKRLFDLFFSFSGLVILFPLVILGWIAASVSTRSNGFYVQKRIGQHGKLIRVYKLKTMLDSPLKYSSVTALNESRITATGNFLRKLKLDELPQLMNVLLGNMSFVGPRPDVPGYADKLEDKDRSLLVIKPGITGYATLFFKYEEQILKEVVNPQYFNDSVIYPLKVKLNLEYLDMYSLKSDLGLIMQTVSGKNFEGQLVVPLRNEKQCLDLLDKYKC
ncbi:sugar transferase [Vibrio sp. C8]